MIALARLNCILTIQSMKMGSVIFKPRKYSSAWRIFNGKNRINFIENIDVFCFLRVLFWFDLVALSVCFFVGVDCFFSTDLHKAFN